MWNCKICEKEFTESQEHVAPCGHAFHMSCLFSSPVCPECKIMIDLGQVKAISDHTVSSGTEKKQEIKMEQGNEVEEPKSEVKETRMEVKEPKSEVKEAGMEVKEPKSEVKEAGMKVKEPEIELAPEDENILYENNPRNGLFDPAVYIETLENRVQVDFGTEKKLTDKMEGVGKANSCLNMQLHLFHNLQELTIASDDNFKRILASISEESNAIPKLVFYCTLMRKKYLESVAEGHGRMKRRRVEAENIEEPGCSNQKSEECSNVEEVIGQNKVDLLSTDRREQVKEPICSDHNQESNCKVGKQTDGKEAELLDMDERGETCSSNASNNQSAELINVPSESSDPWIHEELGWLYREIFRR